MPTVISLEEIRYSATAALFEGGDEVPRGPRRHGFKGAGDDTLRVVSVHPSPSVQQTDL